MKIKIKNVIDTAKKGITDAVDYVVDKNKTHARLNRIKLIIKHETDIVAKNYIELGKYYYENLRDFDSEENKKRCEIIDRAKCNIDKARARYEAVITESLCENKPCKPCDESECANEDKVQQYEESDEQTVDSFEDENDSAALSEKTARKSVKTFVKRVEHEEQKSGLGAISKDDIDAKIDEILSEEDSEAADE